MSDPVPAISESEATGLIAEIYADIRSVYRVGVVNLIWRHLATIPGGLPWVWTTTRPLCADGTVGREATALRAGLSHHRDSFGLHGRPRGKELGSRIASP